MVSIQIDIEFALNLISQWQTWSFLISTLNISLKNFHLILDSQKIPLAVSFSISTLSLLTLAEVWQAGHVLIPKKCDFMICLTLSMQFVDFRQIPSSLGCGCVHCCWHTQCEQSNVVLFQFLWKSMAPNLWVGRRHNYCTFCFLHEFNWSHNINQT